MINRENPTVSVTIQITVNEAKELESVFESLAAIRPDNGALAELCRLTKMIQELPAILVQHDAEKAVGDLTDEEEGGYDGIRFPHTNIVQNWRMN